MPRICADAGAAAPAASAAAAAISADRIGSQELRLKNTDVSLYIQDDIKLSTRLTVNVGLRWDIMVPFSEKNNSVVYFDPKIPNPGADGRLGAATKFGSCAGCAGVDRAAIHTMVAETVAAALAHDGQARTAG